MPTTEADQGQRQETTLQDLARRAEAAADKAEDEARRASQQADEARSVRDQASDENRKAREALTASITQAETALKRGEWLGEMSTLVLSFVEAAGVILVLLAGFEIVYWNVRFKNKENQLGAKIEAAGANVEKSKEGIGQLETRIADVNTKIAETKQAAETLAKAQEDVEKHKLFLGTLEGQVKRALIDVEVRFADSPDAGVIGVDPDARPPQEAYDDDALIALGDRLEITGFTAQALSRTLVTAARYWRRYNDYIRATSRAERAVQLDRESAPARHELGRALWNRVGAELADKKLETARDGRLFEDLARAEREIHAAETLRPTDRTKGEEALFDLATIARFRGDFGNALALYKTAADRSQKRANEEAHEPDWDIVYSMACLLAKRRQFSEAYTLLESIVDKTTRWDEYDRKAKRSDYRKYIRTDPDLAEMKLEKEWGKRLEMWTAEPKADPQ